MFAPLYNCPNCGQVWRVEEYEGVDCERDDGELYTMCQACGAFVDPVMQDGKPVYHALTDEEMELDISWPDESEFDV